MQIDDVEASFPYNGRQLHLKMPNRILIHPMARFLASGNNATRVRELSNSRHISYVLDVGANMGFTALVFSEAWPEAQILALEPSPLNFEYLSHNCKDCENVTIEMKGAFDVAGYMELSHPGLVEGSSNTNTGQLSLYGLGDDPEIVYVDRLDNIATATVDFLKLDVEGAEIEALEGASRIISEDRPILMVEFREYNLERAGHTSKELLQYILDKGYRQMAQFHGDVIFVHESDL